MPFACHPRRSKSFTSHDFMMSPIFEGISIQFMKIVHSTYQTHVSSDQFYATLHIQDDFYPNTYCLIMSKIQNNFPSALFLNSHNLSTTFQNFLHACKIYTNLLKVSISQERGCVYFFVEGCWGKRRMTQKFK